MSYKDTVKFIIFLFIIFFGLFVIISNLCYAQYYTSLFKGYPIYQYGMHPSLYSSFWMYGSLDNGFNGSSGGTMGNYSLIKDHDNIYSVLSGLRIKGLFDTMNHPLMIDRLTTLYRNLSGLEIISGSYTFSKFDSSIAGNWDGLISSSELGSLAGLVSLGSETGLIYSGAADLTLFGY